MAEEKVKSKVRSVTLNGNLLLKRKTALELQKRAERFLSVEAKELQWELEKAKYELDCAIMDVQEAKGIVLINEQVLTADDIRVNTKLTREVRRVDFEIKTFLQESETARKVEKYRALVVSYEEKICAAAGVLPSHVNWEKGTASVPESEEAATIQAEIAADLAALEPAKAPEIVPAISIRSAS